MPRLDMRMGSSVWVPPSLAVVALVGLLGAMDSALRGQQVTPEESLRFDVASIKLSPRVPNVSYGLEFRGSGALSVPKEPHQRYSEHRTTVQVLILRAYTLKPYEVLGLPDWATTEGTAPAEFYDVDAIAPMEHPTQSQLRIMLQSLLAERFQLRAHRDTRELAVYELRVAKGGTKCKPVTGEPTQFSRTMFAFGQSYSRKVGYPIIDRTDLPGYYEFPSIPREATQEGFDSPYGISTVLARYLGLELKPARERMEVLVVDHVERPSPN